MSEKQFYFALQGSSKDGDIPIAVLQPNEQIVYLKQVHDVENHKSKDTKHSDDEDDDERSDKERSDDEDDDERSDKERSVDKEDDIVIKLGKFLSNHYPNISDRRLDALVDLACGKSIQNIEMNDAKTKAIFQEYKDYYTKSSHLQFKSTSGFIPIPYIGKPADGRRDVIYLGGASGIGKSTVICAYAKEFNHIFPKSPIFVLSGKVLSTDPNNPYKDIANLTEVDLHTFADIDPKEYIKYADPASGQSLVIFDDIEAVDNKTLKNVLAMMKAILELGRSSRIYCIISRHIMNDSKNTQFVFNECNKVIIFPSGLSKATTITNLTQKIGLDKADARQLANDNSRYILIQKSFPRYIITNQYVKLI